MPNDIRLAEHRRTRCLRADYYDALGGGVIMRVEQTPAHEREIEDAKRSQAWRQRNTRSRRRWPW